MLLWRRGGSFALLIAVVVAGCAGVTTAPDDHYTDASERLDEGIWVVETGERLQPQQFVEQVHDARYVLVGESHGEMWHHDVQNRIHRELTDSGTGDLAVGVEMIERRFQPVVDEYLTGEIDEDEMLQRVEWDERWGVDEEFYASIWRRARTEVQPVAALNARRELVRRVAGVGIEGLDAPERAELPEIEDGGQEYRRRLREVFDAHDFGDDTDDEAFERFVQAQLVWDETMAQSAYQFLEERDDVDQMLVLAGRGHVEGDHGIPSRLVRRQTPQREVITVVPVSTTGPAAELMAPYRTLEFLRQRDIADYVWIEPSQ